MLTQLSRRDWQRFFGRVSAALAGRAAQVDTRRLIRHPRHVHIHQDGDMLHSVELIDAGGGRDFIVLREPLQVLL